MTLIRIFIICSLILTGFSAYADPAPFGIALNKTTMNEISRKFKIIDSYDDAVPGYKDYYIDSSTFNFDGLTRLGVVCDNKGIIREITLYTSDDNFNKFYKALAGKYKVIFSRKNSIAKFGAGKNQVILSEFKHAEIKLYISYQQKEYGRKFDKALKTKESKHLKHLRDML